ncbi:MAG: hypothetical protein Q8R78_07405 [Candidatus Omnitrophota bacterium]|nr:hypothetical protein [Candidatus Omnitrophota bacterium]
MVAHLALALASPSPWWVPDLTLVGLVLAVGRSPARWFACTVFAGLLTVAWAVRFPGQVFAGYLLIGWVSHLLSRHWDVTDLRIECFLVAAGSLCLMAGMLWLEDLWSLRVLLLTVVRTAVTCGVVPVIHHVASSGPRVVGMRH